MCAYTKNIAQIGFIENTFKNFTYSLDSQAHFYPIDIERMLKYIREHLFENTLTVEKVKRECGFRNNNITTKFRYSIGISSREYIIQQRIEAAADILKEKEVSIYLLPKSIGYTEEAFSKIFKKGLRSVANKLPAKIFWKVVSMN